MVHNIMQKAVICEGAQYRGENLYQLAYLMRLYTNMCSYAPSQHSINKGARPALQ